MKAFQSAGLGKHLGEFIRLYVMRDLQELPFKWPIALSLQTSGVMGGKIAFWMTIDDSEDLSLWLISVIPGKPGETEIELIGSSSRAFIRQS